MYCSVYTALCAWCVAVCCSVLQCVHSPMCIVCVYTGLCVCVYVCACVYTPDAYAHTVHVGLYSVCVCIHTATHCSTLQHTSGCIGCVCVCIHTATHCNTLQHTATHCNALQHTATHIGLYSVCVCVCIHTATHCNIPQHTATHCNNKVTFERYRGTTSGPCRERNKTRCCPKSDNLGGRVDWYPSRHPLEIAGNIASSTLRARPSS